MKKKILYVLNMLLICISFLFPDEAIGVKLAFIVDVPYWYDSLEGRESYNWASDDSIIFTNKSKRTSEEAPFYGDVLFTTLELESEELEVLLHGYDVFENRSQSFYDASNGSLLLYYQLGEDWSNSRNFIYNIEKKSLIESPMDEFFQMLPENKPWHYIKYPSILEGYNPELYVPDLFEPNIDWALWSDSYYIALGSENHQIVSKTEYGHLYRINFVLPSGESLFEFPKLSIDHDIYESSGGESLQVSSDNHYLMVYGVLDGSFRENQNWEFVLNEGDWGSNYLMIYQIISSEDMLEDGTATFIKLPTYDEIDLQSPKPKVICEIDASRFNYFNPDIIIGEVDELKDIDQGIESNQLVISDNSTEIDYQSHENKKNNSRVIIIMSLVLGIISVITFILFIRRKSRKTQST